MAIFYGRHNTPHLLCDTEALQTIGPRLSIILADCLGTMGASDSEDASCDRNAYHVVSFASGAEAASISSTARG